MNKPAPGVYYRSLIRLKLLNNTCDCSQWFFPSCRYYSLGDFIPANILAVRSTDGNRNPRWRLVLIFFKAILQNALHINFVFRRGTFSAVVVQMIYYADGYSGFLLNWRKAILGPFNLATKPTGSHSEVTAVFDAGLETTTFSKLFPCFVV